VPADRKWFARICAAAILAHTLMDIDPHYPDVGEEARKDLLVTKRDLEREAPAGAPADPYTDRQQSSARATGRTQRRKKKRG
jgi:hypothetical protein